MSAMRMTCEGCGVVYMAGMVGMTPWPPHECPSPTLRSFAQDPRATIRLSEEQRKALAATTERDRWIRLFNRLDAAITHHQKAKSDMFMDEVDEALYAARAKVLRDAAANTREEG
jgi:hypothetical protein